MCPQQVTHHDQRWEAGELHLTDLNPPSLVLKSEAKQRGSIFNVMNHNFTTAEKQRSPSKSLLNKYFFLFCYCLFTGTKHTACYSFIKKVENTDVTYVTNVKNKSSILLSPKVRTHTSAYENIHKNTA